MDLQAAVAALLSLALGLVFASSAVPKLLNPRRFYLIVLEYDVVPPSVGRLYASVVPCAELAIAAFLLLGMGIRVAACAASALLITFTFGVGINAARGRDMDCGCHGKFGHRKISWGLVAQDCALIIAAGTLARLSGGWSTDATWSPLQAIPDGIRFAGAITLVTVGVANSAARAGLLTPRKGGAAIGRMSDNRP